MKKYVFCFSLLFAIVFFNSCEGDRKKLMGIGLEKHIIENDADKGIHTKVEKAETISYIELKDSEKATSSEKYSAKMYLKAAWWYDGGNSVYNISDTLNCYFDKDFKCLRTETMNAGK